MGHRHRDMYLWIPDHGFRLVFMASCRKATKTNSLAISAFWGEASVAADADLRLTSRQGAGEGHQRVGFYRCLNPF